MAYSYTNNAGKTYYLHSRDARGGNTKLYFFAREEKEGSVDSLPEGYEVRETGTGLPVLKKTGGGENGGSEAKPKSSRSSGKRSKAKK